MKCCVAELYMELPLSLNSTFPTHKYKQHCNIILCLGSDCVGECIVKVWAAGGAGAGAAGGAGGAGAGAAGFVTVNPLSVQVSAGQCPWPW